MTGGLRPLVLVNSGAYSPPELAAEFGELPPALLPVGLGRLYEHQAVMLADLDADRCLTLPESFEVQAWERDKIEAAGFKIVFTPDGLSLGAALLFALAVTGLADRPLRILHGDTLLHGIDIGADDVVALAPGRDGYRWGTAAISDDGRLCAVAEAQRSDDPSGLRLCGYFSFSSSRAFAERLILAQGDFFEALTSLAGTTPLAMIAPPHWFDFGHVQTYYRSRRIVTTARSFNTLQFGDTRVRKRSRSASRKIEAEARWLTEVPATMAPYCARVLGYGEDDQGYYYDTEYKYLPSLAELYVFGKLALPVWSRILDACSAFVTASILHAPEPRDNVLIGLAVDKTRERLASYAHAENIVLDRPQILNGAPAPSLLTCLEGISSIIAKSGEMPSIMHGDFCFSNILYSFRTNRICLIDPRGLTAAGDFSLAGDMRYDLAKLMHSISGRYDLILAGRAKGRRVASHEYELEFLVDPGWGELERLAADVAMGGVRLGSETVAAVVISLFLSMAPLHADRPDRQAIFIANALRLYMAMEGGK